LAPWGNALTIVAAFGVVGAFIDFYIGKRGQQRVQDWLETWWLRLSYVRWGSFGREEALFAVQVMDRLFGRRLVSIHRLIVVAVTTLIVSVLIRALFLTGHVVLSKHDYSLLIWLMIAMISLSMSLSITRFSAKAIAILLTHAPYLNVIGTAILAIFQYVLFCYLTPLITYFHYLIYGMIDHLWTDYSDGFSSISYTFKTLTNLAIWKLIITVDFLPQYRNVTLLPTIQISHIRSLLMVHRLEIPAGVFLLRLSDVLALIPILVRFSILAIFVGSFFLQTAQRPIMTLWARIIESDKPVFTLLFGGTAALAKAIQEIIKIS
jgi:hypothetical protein